MSVSDAGETWISVYCALMGHEFFAEVPEEFIEDDFNLTGLGPQIPLYKEALELVLDVEPDSEEDEEEDDYEEDDDMVLGDEQSSLRLERRHTRMASDLSVIESSAELLYGLIHQRYITSRQGMQQMLEKYEMQHFGICPRVICNGCKVLPVGRSDIPGIDTVKLYCPSCQDIYTPPNSRFQSVDGAFFGTTFGCLFFMTFPELDVAAKADPAAAITAASNADNARHAWASSTTGQILNQSTQINGLMVSNLAPGLGRGKIYEPRIYGFKVAERAKSGPRMKWLRTKPLDLNELNETAVYQTMHRDGSGSCEENENEHDNEMGDKDTPQTIISQRKKAPIRRRRAPNNPDPTNTNGMGQRG
ncbi:casein kinase 2 regulatory subunit [Myotisia sp. PD_48]|nr:casein kinase 2 regulatory subunit [Myotisia sp. PD_48]